MEGAMSDYYTDPNFRRTIEREIGPVSIWAGLGALAIVVGMFVVLGVFAEPKTHTATNTPAIESTGFGSSPAPAPPQEAAILDVRSTARMSIVKSFPQLSDALKIGKTGLVTHDVGNTVGCAIAEHAGRVTKFVLIIAPPHAAR
jgi:hypothetical protein